MKMYEKYVRKIDYDSISEQSRDTLKRFRRMRLKVKAVSLGAGVISLAAIWLLVLN